MAYKTQPFNRLLEHYVFSAANQYIHLADNQTQSQLIQLISRIDLETSQFDDQSLGIKSHLTEVENEINQVAGTVNRSTKASLIHIRKEE